MRARWSYPLETTLFCLAILVYLGVRIVGLVDFPIFFFTDEAAQMVLASDFVRDGFRNHDGVLLPTFFKNAERYGLSTSVYLQVIPYLLFGKSVFVTRAVAVLLTLPAALCVGLILRNIFRMPYSWAGILLLSAAPAWFLHSRTAFESTLLVSFYAAMLYAYMLYRCGSPRAIYAAFGFAALAFYTYSPAQIVVPVTAILLFLADIRYHWRQRRHLLPALLFGVALALPYLRFRLAAPDSAAQPLQVLQSYWLEPLSLSEKFRRYAGEYLAGLSPLYWFAPNEQDIVRHRMGDWGHLLAATFPLALIGLFLTLRRSIRSPAYRAVLCAMLAAPAGAALVGLMAMRVLVFVIPAVLLMSLGLSWVLGAADAAVARRRLRREGLADSGAAASAERPVVALVVFAALTVLNLGMLRDALLNGPTWYRDYGLYGMQWGARPMFTALAEEMRRHPDIRFIVSPDWTNGTDVVARFFFADPLPFTMGNIQAYLDRRLPLTDATAFVMTGEEFARALASPKFTALHVDRIIDYPDGRTGFAFVRLRYVDDVDAIFAREVAARRKLVSEAVEWAGETVMVGHPAFDIGGIGDAFDGDPDTLVRTAEANPLVVDITFPKPRAVEGIRLKLGAERIAVTAEVYPAAGGGPIVDRHIFEGSTAQPEGAWPLSEPVLASRIRLTIEDPLWPEPTHIHLWEIGLY